MDGQTLVEKGAKAPAPGDVEVDRFAFRSSEAMNGGLLSGNSVCRVLQADGPALQSGKRCVRREASRLVNTHQREEG